MGLTQLPKMQGQYGQQTPSPTANLEYSQINQRIQNDMTNVYTSVNSAITNIPLNQSAVRMSPQNTNIVSSDSTVIMSVNNTNATLPDASQSQGRIFTIKAAAGTTAINILPILSQTIDGSSSIEMEGTQVYSLLAHGGEWYQV